MILLLIPLGESMVRLCVHTHICMCRERSVTNEDEKWVEMVDDDDDDTNRLPIESNIIILSESVA